MEDGELKFLATYSHSMYFFRTSPSLLLHTETSDGSVVPIWEEVKDEDVVVLKDIMTDRRELDDVILQYNRIPITAEKPPDYSDLKELIEVVSRNSPETPIVVNCQLGRGRSTLASVRIYKTKIERRLFEKRKNIYRSYSFSFDNGFKCTVLQRRQLANDRCRCPWHQLHPSNPLLAIRTK